MRRQNNRFLIIASLLLGLTILGILLIVNLMLMQREMERADGLTHTSIVLTNEMAMASWQPARNTAKPWSPTPSPTPEVTQTS